jgi:integrase
VSDFAPFLSGKIEEYIRLRRSLGHSFERQATELRSFSRFVTEVGDSGRLTQALALAFALSGDVTGGTRARRLGLITRLAEYLSIFDRETEVLDGRALPRSRSTPPPRILNDSELARLLAAAREGSPFDPLHGLTLYTIIGLLASSGLRSGEVRHLDRTDVDLDRALLRIRLTKFRKDRLVPVHPSTRAALITYSVARDRVFPHVECPAFFLGLRGQRLSSTSLAGAFQRARLRAGLESGTRRALRPHDLRHRFAVTRITTWHRAGIDVQARLPILATYMGHAHYTDTAYYVTSNPELLGAAAERAFGRQEGAL